MSWFFANWGFVLQLTWQHFLLAVVPLVVSFVLAVPLGWLAFGVKRVRGFMLSVSSVVYTVPSLALFVILPIILGTKILDPVNVVVALTFYSLALLLRIMVDALGSVPVEVRESAVALGFRSLQRFFCVDFVLSFPVLIAGLRVVALSNISLVSVGSVVGVDSLGNLFLDGFNRNFVTVIVVGIVFSLLLALLVDLFLWFLGKIVTPWVGYNVSTVDVVSVAKVGVK